ncbi:MAG: CDP-diacylglycerol--glycerol-3-phosphate 3-phosphatidyltransferase [Candidatus Sumerlaeaceae bacterium]|jgi:CDP-diacylglycerol--glycerol-3-phosphate 3-phosphatidyltransferase
MNLNLPNKLTLLRIILIPLFVSLLLFENVTTRLDLIFFCRIAAFFVFVVAALTDLLDGYLARRLQLVTNFGKLMDPLADKLLTMSAFVAFVELNLDLKRPIFPAWAIIVILAREFLVTGLRALALERGRVIQADYLGKHKTISQLVGIGVVLAGLCLRDYLRWHSVAWQPTAEYGLRVVFWIVLVVIITLTIASGLQYLWKNRDLLSE